MNDLALLGILGTALLLGGCSKETSTPNSPTTLPASVAARAGGAGFESKLCGVLEKTAVKVSTDAPVGAQAELVLAIADAFQADATALRRVSDEIDAIAASGCSAARQSLLATLKMQSLQEAVR